MKNNFKDTLNKIRSHLADGLAELSFPIAAIAGIAGTVMLAGIPAAVAAVVCGAFGGMLFAAAPMEVAPRGVKVLAVALPLALAAGGGALGGLIAGTALAGAGGVAVAAGVAIAIGAGLNSLGKLVSPGKHQAGNPLNDSPKVCGAVLLGAALLFGGSAYHFREEVRSLPVLRSLYNPKAAAPQAPAPQPQLAPAEKPGTTYSI